MSVKSHVLGAYHFNLPKKVVATLSFFLLLDENPGKDPMSMTCQWHLETYLIEPSGGVQICLSIIRSLRMPTRVVGPEGSKMWTCRKPALGRYHIWYHHTTPTMDILFSQHCVPSKSLNMNFLTALVDSPLQEICIQHCGFILVKHPPTYCNMSEGVQLLKEKFRPPRWSSFTSLISSHGADFKFKSFSNCDPSLENWGESEWVEPLVEVLLVLRWYFC